MDVEKLIRPHLVDIKTYASIDPPEALAEQAGIPEDRVIKLNANENPFGASPRAVEAVANVALHVYPDPQQRRMRQSLGEYCDIDPEYIIAGAGSDELIDLLFRLFMDPGDRILDCEPTFGMYSFSARVAEAEIGLVPRDELYEIDLDAVRDAAGPRTKMIFISSPNNPTGNLASESQVRGLLELGLVVVVDEAYYEFSGQTVAGLIPEHENLVVLRTMSKWAGLAGLRIGYGIMSPGLVRHIIDIKSPYNVNVAAEAAILASIEDAPALLEKVALITEERERMHSLLESMPGVTPWPSYGNFILCQFPPGRAQGIYEGLAKRGIFVRNFDSDRLRDCFRTSVGTPDQTDALIEALNELV
jgi:histidinol-phosphate aminotransferase